MVAAHGGQVRAISSGLACSVAPMPTVCLPEIQILYGYPATSRMRQQKCAPFTWLGNQNAARLSTGAKGHGRAYLAFGQKLLACVKQFKAAFGGHQQQRLALQGQRHVKLGQANRFLA
jgi:hypothetical protein